MYILQSISSVVVTQKTSHQASEGRQLKFTSIHRSRHRLHRRRSR